MVQAAKTQESKTQESKTQEPSMEEILASIRRIIADEDADVSPHAPAEPAKVESKPVASAPAPPPVRSAQTPYSTSPAPARYEYESFSVSEDLSGDATANSSAAVLDLTESMATPAAKSSEAGAVSRPKAGGATRFQDPHRGTEPDFDKASERMPILSFEEGSALGGAGRDRLLSRETSAAVDSAFNALAQTVLVHNARTLEDLVREMLRPLLKSWLDDNLPTLVERLVRAEIERVSRGRTG
jgi:uncharacterized protein